MGLGKGIAFVTRHNNPEDLPVIVLPVNFNVNQRKNKQTVRNGYLRLSRRFVVARHERIMVRKLMENPISICAFYNINTSKSHESKSQKGYSVAIQLQLDDNKKEIFSWREGEKCTEGIMIASIAYD